MSKRKGAKSVVVMALGRAKLESSRGRRLSDPKMASKVKTIALSTSDEAKASGSRMTVDWVLTRLLAIRESHQIATMVKR
jgi:hypothetical protein